MALTLELVPVAASRYGYVRKPFDPTPWFKDSWWVGDAKAPELLFGSFVHEEHGEVARVQVNPQSTTGAAYPTWVAPNAWLAEVDLFEVRPDLQGQGAGHEAMGLLVPRLQPPVIALSLNARAADFWRALGWDEHVHPDAPNHPPPRHMASLFAWLG